MGAVIYMSNREYNFAFFSARALLMLLPIK